MIQDFKNLATSMEWQIIATDFKSSGKRGSSVLTVNGLFSLPLSECELLAWYAAYDTCISLSDVLVSSSWTKLAT